jgi:hypothetical protein
MFRGRAAVVLVSFAIATVSLSMFAAVLFGGDDFSAGSNLANLSRQESGGAQAVNFTCHAGSEYAFTFAVEVDLSDGMNSSEATLVATSLYEFEMKKDNYTVKSTQDNGDGTWMVFLNWDGSHYYNVHVNPTNRTVEYSRCY